MQLAHRSRTEAGAGPGSGPGNRPGSQTAAGTESGPGPGPGSGAGPKGGIAGRIGAGVGDRLTWAAAFGLSLALLLAHNLKIFSKPIAENADFAANSLATIEAKH